MRSTSSRKRPKRPGPPDAHTPWKCLVLAVDPGEHCGVAIYRRGFYIDSAHGHGFDPAFIDAYIGHAVFYAQAVELPLVLVLERPPKGGQAFKGRSPEGPASVIGCRKLWRSRWAAHDGTVRRLVCDVYPVTWRSRVLGITRGPELGTAELGRARQLVRRELSSRDEAAANLIAEWASRAGRVGQLLAKGASRRAK